MANISDISRDQWMLTGPLATKGFDWWWHSFTAVNAKTEKRRGFFIEFFTCGESRILGEEACPVAPIFPMEGCTGQKGSSFLCRSASGVDV